MPRVFLNSLRALCAALALVFVLSAFAEQSKAPSLVGNTRDQILARLGEPKSQIKAGAREIMFFAHVKLTLRNDVVVEAEAIGDEPPAKHAADSAPGAPTSATAPVAPSGAASAANQPQGENPVRASATPPSGVAPAAATGAADAAGAAKLGVDAVTSRPTAPPDEQLEIRFVRSPAAAAKLAAKQPPAPAVATAAAGTAPPTGSSQKRASTETAPGAAEPVAGPAVAVGTTVPAATAPAATRPSAASEPEAPSVEPEAPTATAVAAPPAPIDAKKKAAIRRRWRLRAEAEGTDDAVSLLTVQTLVLAAAAAGCVGYLLWRRAQRRLELAATALSSSPFAPAAAPDTTGLFSAELLAKLGSKRFEQLVAAYYAKTGVVAERTGAAPSAAVHIKIFWKGEPKPFAGVQCHANPPALIGAKPLQDLFAALSAAEIRRGYVVTTGRFNVEARDFGEEKHFTLLPGDIFMEKLNALPSMARADLLKEIAAEEAAPPPEQMRA